MTTLQRWAVGIAAFVAVLALAIYLFDWNLVKPYVARKVTAATGRTFAINGDLNVRVSLTPRIRAEGVVLGNAQWSRDPNMVAAKRVEFSIELLPLLTGRVSLPDVALSDVRLVLEVSKDGTGNWVFRPDEEREKNQPPAQFPDIGAMAIDHGTLTFRDPGIKSDITVDVDSRDGPQGKTVEAKGGGTFRGLPATIVARGGELLALRDTTKPYPIEAQATIGSTKARAKGTLIDPLHLRGENIDFVLEGADLALLFPIVGVPLPPTPPYKVSGALNHTGDLWTLGNLKGLVGKSDLSGDFSVDRGKKPQAIKADLVSNHLTMADLGGFIGVDRGGKPAAKTPSATRVLPTEPFSLEKLRAANADVKFRGAHIVTKTIPLEKMDVHLVVNDGIVNLAPLNFSVAGGTLVSNIRMDARNPTISTHAEIAAKGLNLDQLMPSAKMSRMTSGAIGGRAKLAMAGSSLAQMLGSANGEAAVIMNGGTVSELAMRLANLDIANSLARILGGDRETPIRCFVSNWNAVDGNFRVQAMVLDTPKVNVHGTGNVNLRTEALNLLLTAESKTFSLASLRGPINIGGTLKNPVVSPDYGMAIARGGLAAAIGSVTAGIGALIPLLELGKKDDTHCSELKAEAKADVGVKESDLRARKKR